MASVESEVATPAPCSGPVSQIHAGDGGEARRRQAQAMGELLAMDGEELMAEVEADKAARADSERYRLDFEARYDAAKLRWLEGEGDDGGSLWWAKAYTELTCLRLGETPEAFVARIAAMRGLEDEGDDDEPDEPLMGQAQLDAFEAWAKSSGVWDEMNPFMQVLDREWAEAASAVVSIYDAAEAVMAEAGPMPLVSSEPWAEGDEAYAERLDGKFNRFHACWFKNGMTGVLDDAGKRLSLPRARLVLVEG